MINAFERRTQAVAIDLVGAEYAIFSRGQIVVLANCFRVKLLQRGWIDEIVEEQLRLSRNLIERERLDAQTGLVRRTVTGSFSGAQNGDAPRARAFYAVSETSASGSVPKR